MRAPDWLKWAKSRARFSRWILLPYRFSTSPVFKSLLALSPSFLRLPPTPPFPPNPLCFVILPGGAGVKGRGPVEKHLILRGACHEGIRPLTSEHLGTQWQMDLQFSAPLGGHKGNISAGFQPQSTVSQPVSQPSCRPVPLLSQAACVIGSHHPYSEQLWWSI